MNIIEIDKNHIVAYQAINQLDLEEVQNDLKKSSFDLSNLEDLQSHQRKKEWLSVRYLLFQLGYKNNRINYNEEGRPILTNSTDHLSISHSKNMIAIALHKKAVVGIDIQYISDKIMRIQQKFMTVSELEEIKAIDPIHLTYYWTAKEAMFKVYGKKDIFLKQNIEVRSIDLEKKIVKGIISSSNYLKECTLKIEELEDYLLAYTLID